MFEQSLVVSQVGRVSAGARWTWAGSLTLQCCLAATLVVMPMLHPERMVMGATAPRSYVPLLPVKVPEVKVRRTEAVSSATPHLPVSAPAEAPAMTMPARIPHGISAGDPPPFSVMGRVGAMDAGLPTEIADVAAGTRVGVKESVRAGGGPVRVSSGVAAGMLMTPIRPVYPSIAKAAHVEGVVVVAAVISREGRIERAHVVSGPAMLGGAALEAVEAARYAPFRLNGETTEVETTITVNFRIGG